MTKDLLERYSRQIALPQWGIDGQKRLQQAKILVVGAGGLGCPALQYLAAAGVGTLGIADPDVVSLSNLARQVLFTEKDIGALKVNVAAATLQTAYPYVAVEPFAVQMSNHPTAVQIIRTFDVVLDCSDNFRTRLILNDACVLLQKPLIGASILQFDAQIYSLNVPTANGPSANYRDIFPEIPGNEVNCNELGVVGALPGMAGCLQAAEAIKIIMGWKASLANRLLMFNMLHFQFSEFEVVPSPQTRELIPADVNAFYQTDYSAKNQHRPESSEVDFTSFQKITSAGDYVLVDVRQPFEAPFLEEAHISIPLDTLGDQLSKLSQSQLIFICQTGQRSRQAAQIASQHFGTSRKIFSAKGGVLHWKTGI